MTLISSRASHISYHAVFLWCDDVKKLSDAKHWFVKSLEWSLRSGIFGTALSHLARRYLQTLFWYPEYSLLANGVFFLPIYIVIIKKKHLVMEIAPLPKYKYHIPLGLHSCSVKSVLNYQVSFKFSLQSIPIVHNHKTIFRFLSIILILL